ncbi:hypothetical protein FOA52_002412 [Chlamydomonas sp. UWO 241]|nr:hypothetical protein FOA52_002412 [Chlamydomonas sp. UWO 241]
MTSAEPPNKRQRAGDELVVAADAVVSFHGLVSTSAEALAEEMNAGGVEFRGEFFNQHFGNDETIKGFEGLSIKIWFSLRTFHAWLDISWKKRRPGADKVTAVMETHFPHASNSKGSFVETVAAAIQAHPDVVGGGEVVARMETEELGEVAFVKYQLASSGHVRETHERLDALLLFFIDGGSLIDTEDPKWELLMAVQRGPDGTGSLVTAIQTLYNFWAFPSRAATAAASGGARARPPTPSYKDRQREKDKEMQMEIEERVGGEGGSGGGGDATVLMLGDGVDCADAGGDAAMAGADDSAPAGGGGGAAVGGADDSDADGGVGGGGGAAVGGVAEGGGGGVWGGADEAFDRQVAVVDQQVAVVGQEEAVFDASDVANFKRLRLSQVLVLPPYQGLGIGKRMLQLAYEQAAQKRCLDLTIEDPSDNLQRVREKLEVEMLLETPWAPELAAAAAASASSASSSRGRGAPPTPQLPSPPPAFLASCVAELRVPRREARVAWEALLFLQPQMRSGRGRAALEALVRARVDEANFGKVSAGTLKKAVHRVLTMGDAPKDKQDFSFVMMRTRLADADPSAAGGSSGDQSGMAATGRLNVVMMPADEKAAVLDKLVDERMDQLDTLSRLLKPRAVPPSVAVGGFGKPAAGGMRTTHVTAEVL